MATLTSKLIVELIDRATAPARAIAAGVNRLTAMQSRNAAALAATQSQMFGAAAVAYGLAKAISSPVNSAIKLESAMADVNKVTNFNAEGLKQFERDLRGLATSEIPLAVTELAALAAAAAQGGVPETDLLDFTRTVAKSAVAWEVSGAVAGKNLAKLRSALKLSNAELRLFADAINHVSDNTASSAPDLVDFSKRVAAQGEFFGYSKEQTLAFGAAMIGAGSESEVAATSFRNMGRALTRGASAPKRMQKAYAKLGLNASKVSRSMQKDAVRTTLNVIKRLRALPEHMQSSVMSDLFGDEARALAPLLGKLEILTDALGLVTDKTKYAGSVEREFANRAATTEYALQRFQSRVREVGLVIGGALLPPLNEALNVLGPMALKFAKLAEQYPGLTRAVTLTAAGLIGLRVAGLAAAYGLRWMWGGALAVAKAGMLGLGAATKVASIAMWPLAAGTRAVGRAVGVGAVSSRAAAKATAAQAAATLTQKQAAFQSALAMQALARQGQVAGLNAAGAAANVRQAGMALAAAQVNMKAANAGLAATGIGARAAASAFNVLKFAVIGTGIGAILVGIAAAGTWIYNNWSGIKEMFAGIGDGFKRAFGLEGVSIVRGIADGIGSIVNWFGQLLGPLNQTEKDWRAWGETIGEVAGGGVKRVVESLGWMIDKLKAGWDLAMKVKAALGFGGGAAASSGTASDGSPASPEARAAGGPVRAGSTYLVGERGPELWRAPASGSITNALETARLLRSRAQAILPSVPNTLDTVRAIKAQALAGAQKQAGGATTNVGGITIHVNAAPGQSPEAIAAAVERQVSAKLNARLGGSFSDGVYG